MKATITAVLLLACLSRIAAADLLASAQVFVEDLSGNAISSINVGSDFRLKVVVQDIRDPADMFPGIFSAYLKVAFDNTLVTVPVGTTPNFVSPFAQYGGGAFYAITSSGTLTTINAGSFSTTFVIPGNAPQTMFTFQFHAAAAGVESFVPSFDATLGHEFLFYNPTDVLAPSEIQFIGAQLTIVPEPSCIALLTGALGCVSMAGMCVRFRRADTQARRARFV